MAYRHATFNMVRGAILASGLLLVAGCGELDHAELDGGGVAQEDYSLEVDNGLKLPNGVKLPNGAKLPNGVKLPNGAKLPNGVILSGGGFSLNLGYSAHNGVNIGGGVIAPPNGSDLDKWLDSDIANNRKMMRYLVQCAAVPGQSITFKHNGWTTRLNGRIGLAPGWSSNMDSRERKRVSACLLSRVNSEGRHIEIEISSLGIVDNFGDSTNHNGIAEAAFWGNLFADPPYGYMCRHTGAHSRGRTRACGADFCTDDFITDVGRCDDYLGGGVTRCDWTIMHDYAYFARCREVYGGDENYSRVVTAFRDIND